MRRSHLIMIVLLCTAAVAPAQVFAAGDGFARADGPRSWEIPRDHRAHPEFALEWWYFTGHLRAADGRDLGYQATFFRSALAPPDSVPARQSPFAATQALMWHGAVTDIGAGTFAHDEVLVRDAAGWGSASSEKLDVRVLSRSLREVTPERWELRALAGGWLLELDYAMAEAFVVLHGAVPGLSLKGSEPGQASYYVSRVHVKTTGFVTPPGDARIAVTGESWFDQEFGSGQLSPRQSGWDWFSVNLDDGSALMIYMLHEKDGAISPTSSGTLVREDGGWEHLTLPDFIVRDTAWWTSPRTKGTYPAGWIIEIPRLELVLQVEPLVADQERGGGDSAGPAYWEGSCRFTGTREGKPVSGRGYAELVGHAGDVILR